MAEVNPRNLARSALQISVVQVSQLASRLVLTPIVIARLGLEGYGVWVLLLSLSAYVSALNGGVAWAYVKLTAELDERREYALLSQVLSSGTTTMALTAAVLLSLLWLSRDSVLPRIGVPLTFLHEAQIALAVVSTAVLVEVSLGCTLYILAGLQRIGLMYQLILLGSLVEFATSLSLLATGHGMASLAAGVLAGNLVAGITAGLACRRLCPALSISPRHANAAGLRRLMPLGFRLQGVGLLNTLAKESVRLSISGLFGATALGTYQLADRLLFVAKQPAAAILTPLMGAFSGLASAGRTEDGRWLFHQASMLAAIGAALPLLFTAVFAETILFAWTGHVFPDAVWTMRVLAPAEFALVLMGVAIAARRAAGSVGRELRFALAASVLALIGVAVGYPIAGYAGSIAAVALGRGIAATWFLRRLPPAWTLSGREHVRRTVLWPILAVAPIVLAAKGLALELPVPSGRWQTLATLAVLAALSALAGAGVTWRVLLSREERNALRQRG